MASSEVMTACENVCRDFGAWFPNLMSIFGDVATFVGVLVAIYAAREWDRWKRQTLSHKGHSIALDGLEDLRNYETHLNAARFIPTHKSGFDGNDFDDAFRLLKTAKTIRMGIVSKCHLISDLGIGGDAQTAVYKLIYLQGEIERTLRRARREHDLGRETEKFQLLADFYVNFPPNTKIDKDVETAVGAIRDILLRVARFEA